MSKVNRRKQEDRKNAECRAGKMREKSARLMRNQTVFV